MKSSLALLTLAFLATLAPAADCDCILGKNAKCVVPTLTDDCSSLLDYSYTTAGFIQSRSYHGGDVFNGGYFELSQRIAHGIFVDGSFTFQNDSESVKEYDAGIGGYLPLTDRIHLVGRVGYSYLDAGAGFNQLYTSAGFRALLTCTVELYGKLYYVHNRDSDDLSGGGGVIWHINKHWGLDTGAAFGRDLWSWQAGVRYQW